jgi:NitT/TauT family transport system substrate-binding protein
VIETNEEGLMRTLPRPPAAMTAWAVLAVLLAFSLATCARKPADPMRIGISQWTGSDPFFLARDNGYFDSNSAKLVEYTSPTECARAFRNGALDAITVTLDIAIKLKKVGLDAKIVLVIDISNGADVILARPEVRSLTDLRDKRIGIELTAIGDYVLSRALESVGMVTGDVKTVPLEISEHERAFKEGTVDAVVTYEPVRTKLLAIGARKLFDSSQIPGEIVDVMVVSSAFLGRGRPQLLNVLDGWFKAADEVKKGRPDAIQAMAQRERISTAEYRAALVGMRLPDLAENQNLLAGPEPRLLASARHVVEVMLKHKLLDERVDVSTLFDGRYVAGGTR